MLQFEQAMLPQGVFFVAVERSFMVKPDEFLTQISAGNKKVLFRTSVCSCIYFTGYIYKCC